MKRSSHYSALAVLVAAMVSLGALGSVTKAHGQTCGPNISIGNASGCTITICLTTIPAGAIPCQTLPPGVGSVIPVPPGTIITGVTSAAPINYTWLPYPTPPPPLWVPHVTMPPSNCCVDILFDPGTCSISIVPSPTPPACNP